MTPAVEDYLKAIHELGGADNRVTAGEIAHRLGIRYNSVAGMLRRLSAFGWIDHRAGEGVILTEVGLVVARRVIRRHRLVECLLVRVLGLDWSEVHSEAEALEHVISPRLERALADYLGEPAEGPFGHPIPQCDGSLSCRPLRRLNECQPGEQVVIREIEAEDPERLRRWQQLKLVPGTDVLIAASDPLDGVMELIVARKHIRLSPAALTGLRVEPVER